MYIKELNSSFLHRRLERADVERGFTTGINDFFYLQDLNQNNEEKLKNNVGWEGKIERVYLKKVVSSPKEVDSILLKEANLSYYLFYCENDRQQLIKLRHKDALKYIEWGENQTTKGGIKWNKVETVKNRTSWWDLGKILFQISFGQKHLMIFLLYLKTENIWYRIDFTN